MTADSVDKLDRDIELVLSSLVEQLVSTQRVVGGHLHDLNVRIAQARNATDSDKDIVLALVDARHAVIGVVSMLRNCRVDLVRDVTVVREILTGRIRATT